MTTKLYASGGAEVIVREPDADGFQRSVVSLGSSVRALDGTLRQHYLSAKYIWSLKWSGLSSAEYATLLAEVERTVLMTFKPPDTTTTYQVLRTGNVETASDGFSYSIIAVLEQA